jgi:hypothetical protein
MDIIQLISAAGVGGIIGSLLTTVVQGWLSNRQHIADRNFQEKKEVYVGFLQAIHESDINRAPEAAKNVGHWQNRCELVASKEVNEAIKEFFLTNPVNGDVHPDRPRVLREIKVAMRKDLGVQTSG